MIVSVPVAIRISFALSPEIVYNDQIGQIIAREFVSFLDVFFAQCIEIGIKPYYRTIRPGTEGNYSIDRSNLKLHIELRNRSEYEPPSVLVYHSISGSFKIVYNDDTPSDETIEKKIYGNIMSIVYQVPSHNLQTNFNQKSNPIFDGVPSFRIWEDVPRATNLNLIARKRRRAIQGISALPQRVTNIVANYAVGPYETAVAKKTRKQIEGMSRLPKHITRNIANYVVGPKHFYHIVPVPEPLSSETLALPFEDRLERAEAARAAQAARNLEVARQASAAVKPVAQVPEKKKPWWKPWGGKSRKTRNQRKMRKTRGRRRT